MSSIKLPSGLLELIVHRDGTLEMVQPEPICEDYSDCKDTLDLPLEPEQESSSVPLVSVNFNKEVLFNFNWPPGLELSHVISTSSGNQPPHQVHYHYYY